MSKLARIIAREEGFGKPGTVPTRDHNPGDLRHAPHCAHLPGHPNGIGIEPNDADGWADLERQLKLYAHRGFTLEEAIYEFAPPSENNTAQYLAFVCDMLGMPAETPLSKALEVE